jgi:predicted  nucleic acid-binding Zn-ribbon protein
MNRSFKLFRLQQIDNQLDEVRGRLSEIERLLAEDQVLSEARQAADSANEAEAAAQKEVRRADEDAKVQQTKLEQNQTSLYGGKVTNAKELQDLQMEAESLKKHLSGLEEIQLEKMMAYEESQSYLNKAKENLEAIRAQRAVENQTLHSEEAKLQTEAERLEGDRVTAAHGVPDEDMTSYQALRKSKAGLAVAKVQNKTCSACGAELSASLAQAARSPNELAYCSTCKRILYAG